MHILFIIPGDINLPTGGYRYDREIINAWKNSGVEVSLISIKGNYPFPTKADKQSALEEIEKLPKANIAVVDGLLGGASPEFLEKLSKALPVVALIHHPLCLENGLDKKSAKSLENNEQVGLQFASAIVTTSPATTQTVSNLFKYEKTNIHNVLPGVERGEISDGSKNSTTNLLCVGSVIKRKGHKDLLLALANITHLDWHLDCIGSTDFDQTLFAELKQTLEAKSLANKITFHGSVSEEIISQAYENADIFVLPSLYEGYGMAYAEAIVRGLPVIATKAGAIPDTVPETCGILVEPSDIQALSNALEKMISDKALRNQYREATLQAEPFFPTWQSSSKAFLQILKDISL